MNYDDPELRDQLAADYALGVLRGPARRRLERLAARDPALAEAVERWELRLNALAEAAPPIAPPEHVWAAIANSIGASTAEDESTIVPFDKRGLVSRRVMEAWRIVGVAATAIAAALAIYIGVQGARPVDAGTPLAVLNDDAGHPAYVVTIDKGRRQLALAEIGTGAPPAGRAYQLWLLPHGGKPVPLGVLTEARHAAFVLGQDDAGRIATADGMAISQEPLGGSPTGQPTGAIVFKGAVVTD